MAADFERLHHLEFGANSLDVVGERENDRFRLELLSDHSVRVHEKATGAAAVFSPHFTVKYQSGNPGMNTGLVDEAVAFRIPQWGGEPDFFEAAGSNFVVMAEDATITDDRIVWALPASAEFGIFARIDLPPGDGEPRLTYDFFARAHGYFSVGFTGAPELEPSEASWFWQPLIWQEKRFPKRSYLTQEFRCPIPAVLMGDGPVTVGVGVDPAESHFRLPTWNDSRFGVILRNAGGRAQPMIFAPIYGGAGSQMQSGEESSFSLRLIVQQNAWYPAYRDLAYGLYGFSDYRRNNGICNLNGTIDNLVDFILTDQYSYWYPEFKANGYQNDAPGYGRQQSAVYALSLALVRDSREIFERRSLPTIEYVVSRRNLLFNLEEFEAFYGMGGPVPNALIDLVSLYQMSDGRTTAFRTLAERVGSATAAFADNLDPWAGFNREEALDNAKRRLRELIALYRLTGEGKYLQAARTVADYYIVWRIDQPATDYFDAHSSFWSETAPIWDALYELYEETGTARYLDAAVSGMEQFTGYVNLTPPIPDIDVLVNEGGVVRGVPAPEETVPAWRVSEIGLTTEAAGTSHSHRGIFMTPYAAYMMRLSHLTGDQLFHDISRSAVIGRYCNYPSYAYRHFHTTVFEKPDYPLRPFEELTFTSQHYNHPLPKALFLIDFIVSEAFARSEGAIRFPSRYTSTGAYFRSKVYGDRPGKFYDREDAWLWLPRGLLQVDHDQANYLAARGEDALFLVLTNQSDEEITVTGSLNPGVVPYQSTHQASLWKQNQPAGGVSVEDGEFTVTIAPNGITALAIEDIGVYAEFQDTFSAGSTGSLPSGSFQEVEDGSIGKITGMIHSFGGDLNSAFIWLEASPEEIEKATVRYFLDGKWNEEVKASYPFEFTIPLGDEARSLPFLVRGHRTDGSIETSWLVVLEGVGASDFPAGPFYVDPDRVESGAGDSWGTAFNSLTEAVFNASLSISLAGGEEAGATEDVFVKAEQIELTEPLILESGIQLYGGFAGTEGHPEERDLDGINPTFLVQTEEGRRVVEIGTGDRRTTNVRLDGFTLTGARNVSGHGGGMIIRHAAPSVVIENCRISGNSSLQRGGGVFVEGGSGLPSEPALLYTEVSNNLSEATGNLDGGGGIYFSAFSGGLLRGTTISGNRADGIRGGGIYVMGSGDNPPLLIEESRISNNSAQQDGGGIFAMAPVTIRQSILAGNVCRVVASEGQGGGAVFTNSNQANVVIDRSVVSGNLVDGPAGRGGGGAIQFRNVGTVSITNSIISGNSAPGTVQVRGAAIYFRESNQGAQVVNSTIAENFIGRIAGSDGGAVSVRDGGVTFANSIFSGNSDVGIKLFHNGQGVQHSNLFWANEGAAAASEEPAGDPKFVSEGENAVTGTWAQVRTFESDPLTGRGTTLLVAHGTPFAGMDLEHTLINPNTSQKRQALILSNSDHELLIEGDGAGEFGITAGSGFKLIDYRTEEGSAAIDAGDQAWTTGQDLTGGDRPQGSAPDIGAFEFVAFSSQSYQAWIEAHFNKEQRSDPEISGPLVDLLGDGLSNLFKYAFDLDPWQPVSDPLLRPKAGSEHLSMTYRRDVTRSDLTIQAEVSRDLVTWSASEVTESVIEREGNVEVVEVKMSIDAEYRRFLRLRLVLSDGVN